MYLWKMLVPVDLVPLYPYPQNVSLLTIEYSFAAAFVVVLTVACIHFAKKQRAWISAWGYFVVTLLPVLGLVQVGTHSMADRFTYLPSLGPFFLVGIGAAYVWARADAGSLIKYFTTALALALVVSMSYMTLKQISVWRTSIGLWNYVIEKTPLYNPMAYNSRGNVFRDARQFDEAIRDYGKAIEQEPSRVEYYVNRGVVFSDKGEHDRGVEDFTTAITMKPGEYMAYNNRGVAFYRKGDLDSAMKDLTTAITLKPSGALAYNNRGSVFRKKGQWDRALEDYSAAIARQPDYADAYYNRGVLFKEKGHLDPQLDRMIRDLNDHIKGQPFKFGTAHTGIDRTGQYEKGASTELAVKDFQRACDLGSKEGCDALLAYRNR
jgi:tetratricopeptide (TPR) repeat protein